MGSPFASQSVSDPIPLPFDEGQWITVRKLTGRECDRAADAHRGQVASGSPRAWPATFKRALEKGATDPQVLAALADPLTGYDRYVIVRSGLVAWSYPQSVKPVPGTAAIAAKDGQAAQPAVEGSDAVEDLDDDAVDFIAREVLRRTKPALFLSEPEAAAEKKSG